MPMTVFVSYGHPRGDCTLGGVSSKSDMMKAYMPGEEVPAELKEDALQIVVLKLFGVNTVHLAPIYAGDNPRKGKHHMFGGNYGHGDSTWNERVAALIGIDPLQLGPVSIHDRVEFGASRDYD